MILLPCEERIFKRQGPAARLCSIDFGGDEAPSQSSTQVSSQETNVTVTNYVSSPPVSIRADLQPTVNVVAPIDLRPSVGINAPIDLRPSVGINAPISFPSDLLKPVADVYQPVARALETTISAYRTDLRAAMDAIVAGVSATTESQKQATDAALVSLKNVDRLNADLRRTVSYPSQAPVTAGARPDAPALDPVTVKLAAAVLVLWLILSRRKAV
jgi:hypothetical protein